MAVAILLGRVVVERCRGKATSSNHVHTKVGIRVWEWITGTTIHNIEITLEKGRQLARAVDAVTKLIAKEGKSAALKLPSGEVCLISKNCSATVEQVWNVGVNGEPEKFG
ncbi:hypothetical protein Dsin_018057 [Dipteronia sinensis]|uniref:Large ribosomal subunit protein uL2 C-terminal domain-containing protein n=1 Tax=Dipteronia sinensis TaxID=43782 RepID=A0AAE0E712_9ROSI|nr:hypothetical protein Dsin_018057 [Dipteronia sinensis]